MEVDLIASFSRQKQNGGRTTFCDRRMQAMWTAAFFCRTLPQDFLVREIFLPCMKQLKSEIPTSLSIKDVNVLNNILGVGDQGLGANCRENCY